MIIFVDDEPYHAQFYLKELGNAFGARNIAFLETLDEAQVQLDKHAPKVRALILDIMMPPRQGWDPSETEGGLASGVKFMEENAELLKKHGIPVIVLTNRDVNKILSSLELLRDRLHAVSVNQKTQTPAWHLPAIVQRYPKV